MDLSGFSTLSYQQRLDRLAELGVLSPDDINLLTQSHGLTIQLAEKFIENVIGTYSLPLGIATNLSIDNKNILVPMAVEETSIIAAVSKSAKWIKQSGSIITATNGQDTIGQIQLANIKNFEKFSDIIQRNKTHLLNQVNTDVLHGLVKRGGGATDLIIRSLARPDGQVMAVIHLTVNCCDAMGANIINQALEYLKTPIEHLTNEAVTMCILSNLNDQKLTTAKIIINHVSEDLGQRIAEASLFAQLDPYRAATHNKGVLNGIDAVLIATGNDWRAVEAGLHAYAARSGQYRGITSWQYTNGKLTGEFQGPISVGIVGGVTRLHPTAQLALRLMKINSANDLSRICAAVGLVQNLGALRALCSEGIIQGHMKLHIDNLALEAGATPEELSDVKQALGLILNKTKRVNLSDAITVLKKLRHDRAS